MAFQSTTPYSTIFGLDAVDAFACLSYISTDLTTGGVIKLSYYANRAAKDSGKAKLDEETYPIEGTDFANFLVRLAETGGNVYIPSYEYLRTVTNPDGSFKFPQDQWGDVAE